MANLMIIMVYLSLSFSKMLPLFGEEVFRKISEKLGQLKISKVKRMFLDALASLKTMIKIK